MTTKTTNVRKHPRKTKKGRTEVRRHDREIRIRKEEYREAFANKSNRSRTMDRKKSSRNTKTDDGELVVRTRSKATKERIIQKQTSKLDWAGIDDAPLEQIQNLRVLNDKSVEQLNKRQLKKRDEILSKVENLIQEETVRTDDLFLDSFEVRAGTTYSTHNKLDLRTLELRNALTGDWFGKLSGSEREKYDAYSKPHDILLEEFSAVKKQLEESSHSLEVYIDPEHYDPRDRSISRERHIKEIAPKIGLTPAELKSLYDSEPNVVRDRALKKINAYIPVVESKLDHINSKIEDERQRRQNTVQKILKEIMVSRMETDHGLKEAVDSMKADRVRSQVGRDVNSLLEKNRSSITDYEFATLNTAYRMRTRLDNKLPMYLDVDRNSSIGFMPTVDINEANLKSSSMKPVEVTLDQSRLKPQKKYAIDEVEVGHSRYQMRNLVTATKGEPVQKVYQLDHGVLFIQKTSGTWVLAPKIKEEDL